MPRTLVIRLSAMGDVAMLIPVLYSVARHHPSDQFIIATKSSLVPIFDIRPENVVLFPVDTHGKHKGTTGLIRLIREFSRLKIDRVADTHNVLRSKMIRMFFKSKGKKISVIDKGRKEKKALTRKHNKILRPLKSSIERYRDVFRNLGYDVASDFHSVFEYGDRDFNRIASLSGEKSGKWVGIAPFAKHRGKILPLHITKKVIEQLINEKDITIFLFGGGKEEELQLKNWESVFGKNRVISIAGQLSFSMELLLMSYLDVMLSMDSGNMHLASLVGTPVISVWGATHPYAGFYGYGQDPDNAIQIDLYCRPCSVYGNKPCFRHDYACLNEISPQVIVDKINFQLKK